MFSSCFQNLAYVHLLECPFLSTYHFTSPNHYTDTSYSPSSSLPVQHSCPVFRLFPFTFGSITQFPTLQFRLCFGKPFLILRRFYRHYVFFLLIVLFSSLLNSVASILRVGPVRPTRFRPETVFPPPRSLPDTEGRKILSVSDFSVDTTVHQNLITHDKQGGH